MRKLQKKFLFFILFSISCNENMHSQEIATHEEQSIFSRENIKKISTILQYYIIIGGNFYRIVNFFGSIDSSPDIALSVWTNIPEAVASLPSAFGSSPDTFTFFLYPGDGARIISNKIFVGEQLLHFPSILRFAVGHELAHDHYGDLDTHTIILKIKTLLGIIITSYLAKKCLLYAQKKCDAEKHPYVYRILLYSQKIIIIIDENPLLQWILQEYLLSAYSRYCEKRADLLSAKITGESLAGMQYFSYAQHQEKNHCATLSVLQKLWNAIGSPFASHPQHAERVRYLTDYYLQHNT